MQYFTLLFSFSFSKVSYYRCYHYISKPVLFLRTSDVRADCLCASLLRTQFMSQRHATSCTSARAKKEIYSHEGIVAVALTLLRFNSLERSVTSTFPIVILDKLRKNEQKVNVGGLKFSRFSTHATSNSANLRLSGFANSLVY